MDIGTHTTRLDTGMLGETVADVYKEAGIEVSGFRERACDALLMQSTRWQRIKVHEQGPSLQQRKFSNSIFGGPRASSCRPELGNFSTF